MIQIPKAMGPDEASAARERFLAQVLVPYAAKRFGQFAHLRSAAFCIAQFWCDEALDAVHYEWVFSELDTPDVSAGLEDEEVGDPVNLPSGPLDWGPTRYPPLLGAWDSNMSFIPLFAAFCKEDCDQEMDPSESFVPYAVFTRAADEPAGVSVQVVGQMRRPWLDGVAPLWDGESDGDQVVADWDAFVARYAAPGSDTGADAVIDTPPAAPAPSQRRRWWQRR